MRAVMVPDDHGGNRPAVYLVQDLSAGAVHELLGGEFDAVITPELLAACGMADTSDYRVLPVMLVRRDANTEPLLPHNTYASDRYCPDPPVRGPVLLVGLDQSPPADGSLYTDVPPALRAGIPDMGVA